jgi:prolyl-tRNA editing enzyme YbaK/EbsC (Cys-tRNA(Pro) deacylase)
MELTHPRVRLVVEALAEHGARGTVRMLPDSARTAAEAAGALDVPVGAIVSSLVFRNRDAPLLVLTSGAHRVDVHRVAATLGVPPLERADAAFVRAHTGQAIGGVSPVGHPTPLRTLVDRALADHDVVWAAAGHPHAVFPTTFDELVALTGGTPADVA